VLQVLAAQIEQLAAAVAAIEKQLMAWHKREAARFYHRGGEGCGGNPVSQRLASVPGIGPIIAPFRCGRFFDGASARNDRLRHPLVGGASPSSIKRENFAKGRWIARSSRAMTA
jgi:hypothetical protein